MKFTAIVLVSILILAAFPTVFANGIPTQGDFSAGDANPPIVEAKAEWIGITWDDDSTKPYLQVNPPKSYGTTKTLYYVLVATDYDGYDDLSSAYVDVYHPDGTKKYQQQLPNVISCTDNTGQMETWIGYLEEANNRNLITFGNGYTLQNVKDQLRQCSAKLFYGTADLDYCQMCGQFTWTSYCSGTPPCVAQWVATSMTTGYKVEGYAIEKSGGLSPKVTNYFEYICQTGLETDFNRLDFESIKYMTHKWIEGDRIWNTLGPACKVGTSCIPPSIRNIGNIPSYISITQDDMGFDHSGTDQAPDWNVQWDARLGEYNEHTTSVFNPYEKVTLDGQLGLCEMDKISFSIYVKKAMSSGSHSGTVTIEPVPVDFPWWTPLPEG